MKEIKNIQIDDETYEICGGGTSEKEWELLADITTQEEVNTIDITQALDETLFSNLNLTEMFIFFRVKPTEDVDNDYGVFIVNDKNIRVGQQFSLYTNGQFRYLSVYFKLFKNGDAVIQFKDNNNSALASNNGGFQFQFAFDSVDTLLPTNFGEKIEKISIKHNGLSTWAIDSKVRIYGR